MRLLLHGFLIACMFVGSVAAQHPPRNPPPPPSTSPAADPMIEARRLFDEATEHYKMGRFNEALTRFEAAYALYKSPAFLFNIAQCNFQLQNWDRAVFFFEGYLRDQPQAANRELVEDLIRDAREREQARRHETQRKLDLEKERLELEKKQNERFAAELDRLAMPVVTYEKPLYKKVWFWAVVGGFVIASVATTAAVATRDTVLPSGSLGTVDQR